MNTQARIQQIATGLEPKKNIEAALAAKAWDNPTFRQELLSNPREVMTREIDGFSQLPANVKISIIEEEPNTLYFVLPNDPVPATGELSEEELEVVAGGLMQQSGSNCCVTSSICCETL